MSTVGCCYHLGLKGQRERVVLERDERALWQIFPEEGSLELVLGSM